MNSTLQLKVTRQSEWQQIPFSQRHASFEVSVGNPRCAGDYIACQIRWARDRFSSFEFSVGDMLNIHDYIVVGHPRWGILDKSKAWEVCRGEGEAWLKENLPVIRDELGGNVFAIKPWSEWLANPSVKENIAIIQKLYQQNRLVNDTMKSDVETYVQRRYKNFTLSSADLDELVEHLVEELAVYKFQTETRRAVNLYPGSNPVSLRPKADVTQSLPAALRDRQFVQFEIHAKRQHG